MAYQKNTVKLTDIKKDLDRHDDILVNQTKAIKEQESVTKFFVIVVAATLVATLVGIAGLYISAFHQEKSNFEFISLRDELTYLRNKFESTDRELGEYKIKLELIKAKNPYLKY